MPDEVALGAPQRAVPEIRAAAPVILAVAQAPEELKARTKACEDAVKQAMEAQEDRDEGRTGIAHLY